MSEPAVPPPEGQDPGRRARAASGPSTASPAEWQAVDAGPGDVDAPGRVEAGVIATFAAAAERSILLAVSGGRDSMVMLHACVRLVPGVIGAVATFDHGTGPHAGEAVALVRSLAKAWGCPVLVGVQPAEAAGRGTEASWRDARWRFLRAAAREIGAQAIATAHTADDQRETVALRIVRGASARGLGALAIDAAGISRPLLGASRGAVAAYATAHRVPSHEDPSNHDRRHARVRWRAELLPAVERVRPGTSAAILAVAGRATEWRAAVDAWAAAHATDAPSADHLPADTQPADAVAAATPIAGQSPEPADAGGPVAVRVTTLAQHDAAALATFWPAFAGRAGVRLDRRAIARLVAFTRSTCDRVAAGTGQPARIPVASVPAGAAVILQHRAVRPSGAVAAVAAGGWTFVVRSGAERPGMPRPAAAPRPAPGAGTSPPAVAPPRHSDYA